MPAFAPGIVVTTVVMVVVVVVVAMNMIKAKERYADGPGSDLTPQAIAILASKNAATNVPTKLFFNDASQVKAPTATNNHDPYFLEKVTHANNISSLRFTINDDADESVQIWGNSCASGNCAGTGTKAHHFRADGAAAHKGSLVVGLGDAEPNPWGFNTGLHVENKISGGWSHLPWKDGINYIRGRTQVDGVLSARDDVVVGGSVSVKNDIRVDGANGKTHHIRSDGAAAHSGSLVVGGGNSQPAPFGFNSGIHTHNPKAGWSHFPWVDGINYLRGRTRVDGVLDAAQGVEVNGKLCIEGTCISGADLGAIKRMAKV